MPIAMGPVVSGSAKLSTPESLKEQQEKAAKRRSDRLIAKWGSDNYTDDDVRYLEGAYNSLASEYKGNINPRLEMNIVDICKWRLERERCVRSGDVAGAKRYTEMIKTTMDSEAMKVGDSKAQEAFRVDSLVERLEQKGLLRDGVFVLENVVEYVKTDGGRFDMSRDALDTMMLSMLNAYRFNQGMGELTDLEQEMRVVDKLGEFMEVPDEVERRTMFDLGVQVVHSERKKWQE